MKSKPLLLFLVLALVGLAMGQTDELVSPSEKNPKAMELVKRAISLEDAGLLESAVSSYQGVLKLQPNDFAAMNSIAGLYGKLQKPNEEISWAKKAIDTNPKFYKAYINYGNGFAMLGKFAEANQAYQDAAKLAPNDPLPIYSQGVILENQNKFREALGFYKKSIELDSKFTDGLFSAAAMHANLKEFSEAKALLKKVLEINPKDAEALQMLQAIEREKPE
jgi:tetratricopeptide (TPR) repeat protein